MTLQRHQIGAQRAAAVRHSNPWTTQRNERETLGYRGNCYCHVQDEAVELDIVLYYVKMTEQTGLKQVPVCLEHSSCVEPTGGRDDTATGLPQAKKIWVYPGSGAQPRGDLLCSMASSSRRRSFMPSTQASVVHACIMQACLFVNRLISRHQHLNHASRRLRLRLRRDEHCGSCGCTHRGMQGGAQVSWSV